MLNNVLGFIKGDGSYWAGQQQSPENWFFENKTEAFLYALIGFVVVFIGIILIIFIIWLVGLLMKKTDNLSFMQKKGNKNKAEEKKAEASAATAVENDGEIPDEVKAAIIAAIMAYYEEKQEKCEFTVKRIKRI